MFYDYILNLHSMTRLHNYYVLPLFHGENVSRFDVFVLKTCAVTGYQLQGPSMVTSSVITSYMYNQHYRL